MVLAPTGGGVTTLLGRGLLVGFAAARVGPPGSPPDVPPSVHRIHDHPGPTDPHLPEPEEMKGARESNGGDVPHRGRVTTVVGTGLGGDEPWRDPAGRSLPFVHGWSKPLALRSTPSQDSWLAAPHEDPESEVIRSGVRTNSRRCGKFPVPPPIFPSLSAGHGLAGGLLHYVVS